ncbi:MAG: hypothetical protein LBT16_06875 [Treponema sp.]|jgi:hypothetical protein|nr:hypothetical protein [Treponema sp.]
MPPSPKLPLVVETRQPEKLPPLLERRGQIAALLLGVNLEGSKKFYHSLGGGPLHVKGKAEIVKEMAEFLSFEKLNDFNDSLAALPQVAQKLLRDVVFWCFIPIEPYKAGSGKPLIMQNKSHYWVRKEYEFDPELRLDFLGLYEEADQLVAYINPAFREILQPWFVPPLGGALSDCAAVDIDETQVWSNAGTVADSLPLLCDALSPLVKDMERSKAIRGFIKRDCNGLRTSSGFMPFAQQNYAPDSVDLAARFILCMSEFKPQCPKDVQLGLRTMIDGFFNGKKSKNRYPVDQSYFEYCVLHDHLSKIPGIYFLEAEGPLPSRQILRDILLAVARDDRRFNADLLAAHIRFNYDTFYYYSGSDLEERMKLRADRITINGIAFNKDKYGPAEFKPTNIMRFELLAKPLFKAYCYVFAALGLLEITQKTPEFKRSLNGKTVPISPYDSLDTIRVTDLGRWCLGLSGERPPLPERRYEAIADRELRLVTVQGTSLERSIYLDRVGIRLGKNRWRISPASFIAGCETQEQILERIDKFTALIDPNPAPHWKTLFAGLLSRAGLFDEAREDAAVYRLPRDRAVAEELLADPSLAGIALRAEGRLLVVPAKHRKKFTAFLAEHGITLGPEKEQ